MKALDYISRLLLGAVFVFSGYVKAVDPLGTVYKISDYLVAYHMDFLLPLATIAAMMVIAVELMLGFAFVFNLFMRVSASVMVVVELFFTVLTLISWQTNAVSDCGCFGDFVKLSNEATFWKNMILMVPVVYVWFRRTKFPTWAILGQAGAFLGFLILSFGFQWSNMSHLPIQDFRPYKVGVDIKAQMELPEGAKKDSIVTLLYYKKNGVVKEFTESNYPWEDSTWVWVDTKSTVVKEGDRAPIHNFSISDEDGNDIVPEILANPGFKLLLISYKIEKADDIGLKESVNLHKWCDENKVLFYAVSSSLKSEVELKDKMFGLNYPFYTADEITLKTIIRSNPGFVLLKGSVIVAKWHYNDVPTETEFMSYLK